MSNDNLLPKIEELRNRLEEVSYQKQDFNFQDPEVIEISQQLDKLLVKYSKLIEEERNNKNVDNK